MIDKTSNGFNLCHHKKFWPSTLILYSRGSQPGVHVPPGVHLPTSGGTLSVHLQQIKFET